ncbi:MAG: ferrous iron transport protein A [Deltaproteobacteria bacterium]|nr:ferrous iron transport protein A [Deltaproteobacteria bacterium]
MMPLGILVDGEEAEVMVIGKDNEHRSPYPACRLERETLVKIEDMGIRVGKKIKILNNARREPLLVKVDESRIALARGMAMKILVRRRNNESNQA